MVLWVNAANVAMGDYINVATQIICGVFIKFLSCRESSVCKWILARSQDRVSVIIIEKWFSAYIDMDPIKSHIQVIEYVISQCQCAVQVFHFKISN